jgi:RimJ/RimL family protein N-acetyltransferase
MHHVLSNEGYGVRIRPVRMADAAFIVWLRNQNHAKGKLGDSATNVPAQERWLEDYFERTGDFYFIAETLNDCVPVGTTSIYDQHGELAETGRFVVSPEVPAAFQISILTYDLAFQRMQLKQLRATSVATNRTVHSYIRKLGFLHTRTEKDGRFIGGQPADMLHFSLSARDWDIARAAMLPLAKYAESEILQWERNARQRTVLPHSDT